MSNDEEDLDFEPLTIIVQEEHNIVIEKVARSLQVTQIQDPAVSILSEGAQGIPGGNGEDGTDGIDGIDGTDGTDGVDGLQGPPGYTIAPSAQFSFSVPSSVWELPHNLGRKVVDVVCTDTNDREIIGDVIYVSDTYAYVEWYYQTIGNVTVSL